MLLRIVSVCYETLFQSARALMGNMEWWELTIAKQCFFW